MVFQFLSAVGRSAEKGAAAGDQVGAQFIVLTVDQEIFLLGPHVGEHMLGGLVAEQLQQAEGLLGKAFHRAQQRRFVIQGFFGIAYEGRGNGQGGAVQLFLNEGGRRGVPSGVAAGLEGGTGSA